MSTGHLVDITVDPADESRRRRRALLRIGLPIGGVALIIAVILGIALYSHQANRAGVLRLSDGLLREMQGRIALQVVSYLEPATRAAQFVRTLAADSALRERSDMAQAFAATALTQLPQVDAFDFADADGNFMMVRHGDGGGIDTKLIRNSPGARQVTWIRRDAAGREIARQPDPTDSYDPRTRTWFTGASNTDGVFWSDVYVFYTSESPGVTAAVRYLDQQGRVSVFGVDIALKALSEFLASLRIGRSGRAVIMDGRGTMVAMGDMQRMLRQDGSEFVPARIDQVGDAELTAAYDRYRVTGYGRNLITVGDRRIVSIVAPLRSTDHDWSMVIVVPEDDFIGFVDSNSRTTLAMSLAVVAVAMILAALLVRQGLRGDRMLRAMLQLGHSARRQTAAFATLVTDRTLFDPREEAPPHALTETLVEIADARRASLWRLIQGGQAMRCEDSYDRDSNGHVNGLELSRSEAPRFFARLAAGEEIESEDAGRGPHTGEVYRIMMQPLGSRGLLAVPVRHEAKVVGAVWLEDARAVGNARDFVRAVANMAAARLRIAEPVARFSQAAVHAAPRLVSAEERNWSTELAPDRIAADDRSSVAVMVLQLSDPAACEYRLDGSGTILADSLVSELQRLAAERDIAYLKMLGHDIVAAASCGRTDVGVMQRLADTALAARDMCAQLFEDAGLPPAFRIGIECGSAGAVQVGREPRLFNLWGEAVRTASAMAASVMPGAIQVTESVHRMLTSDFLFRPRGSFYVPRVGAVQTFILASRL